MKAQRRWAGASGRPGLRWPTGAEAGTGSALDMVLQRRALGGLVLEDRQMGVGGLG